MVGSTEFFPTLAQSTATVAGLIITVSAVQYQLEKQRRQSRTEDLRKELLDFKNKYDTVLPAIGGELADGAFKILGANPLYYYLSNDEIEAFHSASADKPTQSTVWTHFSRVSTLLTFELEPSSEPKKHYLLSEKEFDAMGESIKWLDENFKENTDVIDSLYDELGLSDQPKPYLTDEFDPDPPEESVQDWLNKYQPYTKQTSTVFSGKNLQSFRRVVEEMKKDYEKLDAIRKNTIINYRPKIGRILKFSALLIFVGVLLPVGALITNIPPSLTWLTIPADLLFYYQFLLTAMSFLLMGYLLYLVGSTISY